MMIEEIRASIDLEAFEYYMNGAELNDAECQYNVAKCIYNGDGTRKNPRRAKEWYQKALEYY